jgi:hypothetical protein
MTAEQAYWFGRIDEVLGRTDLPCPRLFVEYSLSGEGDPPERADVRPKDESVQPLEDAQPPPEELST